MYDYNSTYKRMIDRSEYRKKYKGYQTYRIGKQATYYNLDDSTLFLPTILSSENSDIIQLVVPKPMIERSDIDNSNSDDF